MPNPASTDDASQCLIYLVDDEETLLNIAEVALARNGYRLKKFQDPVSALDSFNRETPKPSLLMTDYAMSPMNGVELSAKCKSAHPELKVLIVSGTAGPEIVLERPDAVDKFLNKPYALHDLISTVRAMLEDE
jgi:DNA-binding NtrC family response regulator